MHHYFPDMREFIYQNLIQGEFDEKICPDIIDSYFYDVSRWVSSNSMVDYEVDSSLPKIGRVEYTVGSSEIGFEWKAPFEKGLDGINIYRSRATPNPLSYTTRDLIKIATIDNPYISHYVR